MTNSSSTDGSTPKSRSDAAPPKPPPAGAEPPSAEPPSAELLEFLGEFDDAHGEWIDPFDLDGAGDEPKPQ